MPKISVFVPIYNSALFLEKCIASILSQTFHDFELLLIDDGSTDTSGRICDKYALRDRRIRVFHKQNEGISATREFAIQRAKGDYIQFVDSDDWIEKDMLEKMVQVASQENLDAVSCNFYQEYKSNTFKTNVFYANKEDLLRAIISNKWGVLWRFLFKRKILVDNNIHFPKNIDGGEDYYVVVSFILCAKKVKCIDEYLYHYIRFNSESFISQPSLNRLLFQVKATYLVEKLLIGLNIEYKYKEELNIRKCCSKSVLLKSYFFEGCKIYPEIGLKEIGLVPGSLSKMRWIVASLFKHIVIII